MGGTSDSETIVRYAPYLEKAHSAVLNHSGGDDPAYSFIDVLNATFNTSPYGDYENVNVDDGYLGFSAPGVTYELGDYPSLWDMFGKFMAGLDVHSVWSQIYTDVVDGAEITEAISAHSAQLQNDIDTTVIPKFIGGMRDINSVQSSTFIIGQANIQSAHVRAVNEFASNIRIHAIDISNQQWIKHLEWNNSVITTYANMFQMYFTNRSNMDKANLEYQAKDATWNLSLFENARAIIGALNGAAAGGKTEQDETMAWIGLGISALGTAAMFI